MSDKSSSDYRSLMIAALISAAVGWPGLLLLMNKTLPTVGPRWLFFFLWTLATTGTGLPFIWLLHRRFDDKQQAPASVLLRQALMLGLYASTSIWLQINGSLTLSLALILAVGLAAIEWFLHLLERTAWRPTR
jgi:hypothetical protein